LARILLIILKHILLLGIFMQTLSSKPTSASIETFETTKSLSFLPLVPRLEEIDIALENIFCDKKYLSSLKQIKIAKMRLRIQKIKAKYAVSKRKMLPLDEMRIVHFQERIDTIYLENEPTSSDFLYAESLLLEKERLLAGLGHL